MDRILWVSVRLGSDVVCLKKGEPVSMMPTVAASQVGWQTIWSKKVNMKIHENSLFRTFCSISWSLISLFYKIVTGKWGYKKMCSQWLLKMLTDAHKRQCVELAQKFLQSIKKMMNFSILWQEMKWTCISAEKLKHTPSVRKKGSCLFIFLNMEP